MSRSDSRVRGKVKKGLSTKWTDEEIAYLKAEAARRTKDQRMARAREIAIGNAVPTYEAHEASGSLLVLGPEISVADILHMALDLYRGLG